MPKLRKLTYANAMSTIAVVFALAGGSTAVAVTVNASKKSDVNKKGKIRAGRVTTPKLADAAVSAPKLGAIRLVQVSDPSGRARATCASSERLLSGGALTTVPAQLVTSRPDGNGWEAVVDGPSSVTAYALCLR